jgi:hypothetical protein
MTPEPVGDQPTLASPTQPPEPTLPPAVGGFPVAGELGRGGMGVVYAARDPHLGRPVAVKVLRADGPVPRERFLRSAT